MYKAWTLDRELVRIPKTGKLSRKRKVCVEGEESWRVI